MNKETLLESLTVTDQIYQEYLQLCMQLEPEFLRIRHTLPQNDQEILDRYFSCCEELDHRRLSLALTI